jgi:hypothetical protein
VLTDHPPKKKNKKKLIMPTYSLELSAAYFQSANSVFLSQQINQQCFQPLDPVPFTFTVNASNLFCRT